MQPRLDEQQLAEMRTWAEAMLTDDRAELRAAARGLLLLADEVERLWDATRTAALAQRLGTADSSTTSPE
jgi:hypothetical protein